MNYLDILKKEYDLSEPLAKALIEAGRVKVLPKGTFAVFVDQVASALIFPLDGRLGFSSSCTDSVGRVFNIITPGIVVNEAQFLLGEKPLTDIIAVKNSLVLQVPFSRCHRILNKSREFSGFLNISLAKKQRAFHALFQLRAMKSHRKKVYGALSVISGLNHEQQAHINFVSLASLLNMSRNTVSKEIKALTKLGMLSFSDGGYVVSGAMEELNFPS